LEFLLVRSQVGLENFTESGSRPVVVLEAWFEAPMKHAEDEEKQVDCGLWSGQPRHAFTSPQDFGCHTHRALSSLPPLDSLLE
jgi:hypothetical protein